MDDGSQRMYYVGQQQKNTAVGVAKLEYGSSQWVKEQSSIVFAVEQAEAEAEAEAEA